MNPIKFFSLFIILSVLGILYDKHLKKNRDQDNINKYNLIQEYLFNDKTIFDNRPILWIHVHHDINSRHWLNFMSKNTNFLNQSYKELCIESIIKHCSNSFNICIIDDESFGKILPKWSIQMNKLADPIKSHIRTLGLFKVLYKHGGMLVPSHFICLKDMIHTHNKNTRYGKCYVSETVNHNRTHTVNGVVPSSLMMGCDKENETMGEMIQYLENVNSTIHNDFYEFESVLNHLYTKINKYKMNVISAQDIGIKNKDNKLIIIDDLMSNAPMNLLETKLGILVDDNQLQKRRHFGWFLNQSKKQVLESNINMSKYIILALNSNDF